MSEGSRLKWAMSYYSEELLKFQCYMIKSSYSVYVWRLFLWNFKCSLWNVAQNILPVHQEMFILVKDENVIALTFTSHKPILKRALNNLKTPCSAWNALWVVIKSILYQLSNLITIHLFLIGYKVHFHIGLYSVNEPDPHYKATTWHSYLARLTNLDRLTLISCSGFTYTA